MANYSLLDLRRFASEVLPFLCILVVGELRGNNANTFEMFKSKIKPELLGIAMDQKVQSDETEYGGYCMYLVNFHDYIEAILHTNLNTIGQNSETAVYTTDIIKVRRLLTRLEVMSSSDSEDACRELFVSASDGVDSDFNVLLKCLHTYFMHILVMNVELQRAKNQAAKEASSSTKEKLIATSRVCVSPELPCYLVDVLTSVDKYCTQDAVEVQEMDISNAFVRETNIRYETLQLLSEYNALLPVIKAYQNTLTVIQDNSKSCIDICNSILASEIWVQERSV